MRGHIHSYYTPSQVRSQNATPFAVVSEMIERAIQLKEEQHKQEIKEQRAQMEERLARQREEHRLDIDAINRRFIAQIEAYDARFRSLEGGIFVNFKLEVTTERTAHDLGSPARPIVRSSADSTHGNNQVIFLLSFSYYHFV